MAVTKRAAKQVAPKKSNRTIKTITIDNNLKVTPAEVKLPMGGGLVRLVVDPGVQVDVKVKATGDGGGGGGGTVVIHS